MALTLTHYRFYNVDGNETNSTAKANEDTAIVMEQGTQALIRMGLQNNGTAANNAVMQAQCRKLPQGNVGAATAWANVNNTNSLHLRTGANAVFSDAANCTKRLSGTGTFEASAAGCTIDGSAGGSPNDVVSNGCTEFLMGFQVLGADVDQGDKIELRITDGTTAYPSTVTPTITVGSVTTIAQVSLGAGATGNRISPNIPTASVGYLLTIQQVGWAHTGGDALKVWLDVSFDGGTNWTQLTADVFPDEAVTAHGSLPADAFRVSCGLEDSPEQNGIKRKLRMRYEAVKAVTVSGVIVSL